MPRDPKLPHRSLSERMALHQAVMKHRGEGLSYNAIIAAVEKEFGVRLNKSTISNWVREDHVPDGSVTKFEPKPTEALAYVIGATLGDGSTAITGDHEYMVKLKVKDKDFAEAYSVAIGRILHRTPPRLRWNPKRSYWEVEVSSLLLLQFLRQPIEALAPSIGHCDRCSGAFLRGFFDAEGSVSKKGRVSASNTDPKLIALVLCQLQRLGIRTYGPYRTKMEGKLVTIEGKVYRANHDQLTIGIRAMSVCDYSEKVGFCIARKRERLSTLRPQRKG